MSYKSYQIPTVLQPRGRETVNSSPSKALLLQHQLEFFFFQKKEKSASQPSHHHITFWCLLGERIRTGGRAFSSTVFPRGTFLPPCSSSPPPGHIKGARLCLGLWSISLSLYIYLHCIHMGWKTASRWPTAFVIRFGLSIGASMRSLFVRRSSVSAILVKFSSVDARFQQILSLSSQRRKHRRGTKTPRDKVWAAFLPRSSCGCSAGAGASLHAGTTATNYLLPRPNNASVREKV